MGAPVDLKTWTAIGRNRMIGLLLFDHDVADVRPVRGVHLHGSAAGEADGGRAGRDRRWCLPCYGVCGVIGIAIATPHRRFLGRLEDLGAVHGAAAGRRSRLGAQRRHLSADGGIRRDLGHRALLPPIRCSRCGWSAPRLRSPRPRCRSIRRCSTSGRPSDRRSAAFCTRAISSTPPAMSRRPLSRWRS